MVRNGGAETSVFLMRGAEAKWWVVVPKRGAETSVVLKSGAEAWC